LIPYLQKILNALSKKVTEQNPDLHPVLADSVGCLVLYIVDKGETYEQQIDLL